MATSSGTSVDTEAAKRLWEEYTRTHDVSDLRGKTAGIDPITENIWIGDSILDVFAQRTAAGVDSLLYYVRIGSKYYFTKRWRE